MSARASARHPGQSKIEPIGPGSLCCTRAKQEWSDCDVNYGPPTVCSLWPGVVVKTRVTLPEQTHASVRIKFTPDPRTVFYLRNLQSPLYVCVVSKSGKMSMGPSHTARVWLNVPTANTKGKHSGITALLTCASKMHPPPNRTRVTSLPYLLALIHVANCSIFI